MITFEIQRKGSYDILEMYQDNVFIELSCVFKNSFTSYSFSNKKGGSYNFKTYEEAISAAKNLLRGDPYADANDRISKSIEANVIAAKYKMNLRAAEFRGFLFNQVVQLKRG